MDYDGFRQMVLGANLFSLKTKELLRFSEGSPVINQPTERIVNPSTLSFNNPKQSEETMQRNQHALEQLLQGRLTKETVCNSFT